MNLKMKKTLTTVIEFAGGLLPSVDPDSLEIETLRSTNKKNVF